MDDTLYIVIPAYNEAENIRQVICDWYPIIEKFGDEKSRLVIFDDGSQDETFSIMLEEAKSRSLFEPITKSNSGHGATVLNAYKYAINHGAKFIFQTDSDGQTIPSDFEKFWRIRKSFDMIIGNRSERQDGFDRKIVSWILKIVLRIIFGVKIVDPNTPFRLMNAETLKKYINKIPSDYNLPNILVSVIYFKYKLSVKFLPITFKSRVGGVNFINLRRIFAIGFQALKDFRNLSKTI